MKIAITRSRILAVGLVFGICGANFAYAQTPAAPAATAAKPATAAPWKQIALDVARVP